MERSDETSRESDETHRAVPPSAPFPHTANGIAAHLQRLFRTRKPAPPRRERLAFEALLEDLEPRHMLSATLPVAAEVGAVLPSEPVDIATLDTRIEAATTTLAAARGRLDALTAPAPAPRVASVEYGEQWVLHLAGLEPGWRIQLDVNVRGGTVDLVHAVVPPGASTLTLTANFHGHQGTRMIEVGVVDDEGNLRIVLGRAIEGAVLPATRFAYVPPSPSQEEIEQARAAVTAAETALAAIQTERDAHLATLAQRASHSAPATTAALDPAAVDDAVFADASLNDAVAAPLEGHPETPRDPAIERLPGDPAVAALFASPTIQITTEGQTMHVDTTNLPPGTYVFDFNERNGSVDVKYVTIVEGQTSVRVSATYPRGMRDWHVLVGRVDGEKNLQEILSLIRNGRVERGVPPVSQVMHEMRTVTIPLATQQRVYELKQEYGINAFGKTRDGKTVRIQEDGVLLIDGEPLVQLPREYSWHRELFIKAGPPKGETIDLTPPPPPTEFPTLETEGAREILRAYALDLTGLEKSGMDLRAIARRFHPEYFAEEPSQDLAMFDARAPQGENHAWAMNGMIGMQRTLLNNVQRGVNAWNTMVARALVAAYEEELRRRLRMEPLREDFVGFNLGGGAHRDAAKAEQYVGLPTADEIRAAASLYFPEIHRKHLDIAGREVAYRRNTTGSGYVEDTSPRVRSPEAVAQHLRVLREAHAADAAAYRAAVDAYMASIGGDVRGVLTGDDVVVRREEVASAATTEFWPWSLAPSLGEYPLTLEQRGSVRLPFTLEETRMVNIWTEGIGMRDVDLTIEGENLARTYASDKRGTTGESISLKLTPGSYTLTVRDATNYDGGTMATGAFRVTIHTETLPYRTQEIIGRVSIPESAETMPVRMRVAEFESGNRVKDYESEKVHPLNPNQPVWVVVHGMNSNDSETKMNNLTRELSQHVASIGFQLVTVDWHEAAKDPLLLGRDAPWTTAVGKWVAHQLLAIGFQPEQISGVGHSHGTYVLWAMGNALIEQTPGHQMNALIALDPAGNAPPISLFDHTHIDFGTVSRNSLALAAAFIADSNRLAGTADTAFRIESPSTVRPSTEHQLGLTAFTTILAYERTAPAKFSQFFALQKLMIPASDQEHAFTSNAYDTFFEGEIDVTVRDVQASDGTYLQATPLQLRYTRPDGHEEVLSFNTFR